MSKNELELMPEKLIAAAEVKEGDAICAICRDGWEGKYARTLTCFHRVRYCCLACVLFVADSTNSAMVTCSMLFSSTPSASIGTLLSIVGNAPRAKWHSTRDETTATCLRLRGTPSLNNSGRSLSF